MRVERLHRSRRPLHHPRAGEESRGWPCPFSFPGRLGWAAPRFASAGAAVKRSLWRGGGEPGGDEGDRAAGWWANVVVLRGWAFV